MIEPIVDKFVESIKMRPFEDDYCTSTVDVIVSKTFFGWLAQFGNNIEIAEPERVREQYIEHLERILENTKTITTSQNRG